MRFAQLVMRHRMLTMILILGATTYLFFNMVDISVRTSFDELLPYKNPYIKLHKEIRDKFGGANLVTISLEVKQGNIFNYETLKKIRYLNDQLGLIPDPAGLLCERCRIRPAGIGGWQVRPFYGWLLRAEPQLPPDL